MRLTVLGCAGSFPGPGTPCSGYLLESDGYRVLVDAGNGSTGTLQASAGLLDLDAVVISHLHGDHFLDLMTYTYARLYHPEGPRPPLPTHAPAGLAQALAGGMRQPDTDTLRRAYEFRELSEGQLQLGPFSFRFARMNHPVQTFGMRISDGTRTLAYSADTGPCPELVELARDCDALLCEASLPDGADNPPNLHLTGAEAAEHAVRAGAGRLLLTHLVPWGDRARTVEAAGRVYRAGCEAVRVGESFEI